jgi:hypothetical protein
LHRYKREEAVNGPDRFVFELNPGVVGFTILEVLGAPALVYWRHRVVVSVAAVV